ncbi:DISARM system phospholipase D-like protein DrmC [Polynucleobacter bastaniensis]|uniref:DISARM system phospholipase D-like protein DrmC n=1 Tax=Polynucleobacter bastaniensis TaxID=2081039 RepID=UPI00210257F2|nr:DISARM system phospholipase D-like protein DrmC [Polynucleobacter bastaniensis]
MLSEIVGGGVVSPYVNELISAWQGTNIRASELALMLLSARQVVIQKDANQSIELVWTGPVTSVVSARKTEQVLLQVINQAKSELIITSFVAYKVDSIIHALNSACERRVHLFLLLESSIDDGGSIEIDVIAKMKKAIPRAHVYGWKDKAAEFEGGRVHAKVAVADKSTCFITSANLTGYAMEKNMELGLLINGGAIPGLISDHLKALVDTKVLNEI